MNNILSKTIATLFLLCMYNIGNISATKRKTVGLRAPIVECRPMTFATLNNLMGASERNLKENIQIVYQYKAEDDNAQVKILQGYFRKEKEQADFYLYLDKNNAPYSLEISYENNGQCVLDSGELYQFFCNSLQQFI